VLTFIFLSHQVLRFRRILPALSSHPPTRRGLPTVCLIKSSQERTRRAAEPCCPALSCDAPVKR
jgi:hypothetical protein